MKDDLRKAAEQHIQQRAGEAQQGGMTAGPDALIHELQVHQVELEMQNEELRQAQHQLAVARDNYVELYDFAPIGYITLNDSGRIEEANFAAASLLGTERGKLLEGQTFAGFIARDSLETWEHYFRRILSLTPPHHTQLILQRMDGSVRQVYLECMPRPDSGRYLMILSDITQQVQTEKILRRHKQELDQLNRELEKRIGERTSALEESEGRFFTLFEESPDACLLLDMEGRFIDGNKAVEQMTGYKREELRNQSIFESPLMPLSARKTAAKRLQRLVSDGIRKLDPILYELRHKDGTGITVEVTTIPVTLKGKGVFLSSARDLTFRKKAEQELKESEEKYRLLFESETDAVLLFDGDSRQFIDVNEAATKTYGYSREEFLQLTHWDITADQDIAEETIRATIRAQAMPSFRSNHRKKDGSVFPVEITGSSFRMGDRPAVCGVVRDVTERVKKERELIRSREELRHLASELSLAGQQERQRISHELHDGICQLLSSSRIRMDALKTFDLPVKTLQSLDKISDIIGTTLEQARTLIFELSCPMLRELGLAAALEELCRSMSTEHSATIEFKGHSELFPLTLGQKTLLYRSTRELLVNVIKHSEAEWAAVELTLEAGEICIQVEDNGKGFDASGAGMGFSPSGGFGLFNLCEYIRHAGGEISVHSTLGSGTTVKLTLQPEMPND